MASLSGRSGNTGRRGGRSLGLSHPRAGEANAARGGRAIANQQERNRVQNEAIPDGRQVPAIADEDDPFALNSQEAQEDDQARDQEQPPRADEENDQGEPFRARERFVRWLGNTARLNIMARTLLLAPLNFETLAGAANRQSDLDTIRNMKRIQTSALAWDNLKHSGKTILLNRVCADLNADAAYLEAAGGARLNPELLRQKMNQFITLAQDVGNDGASNIFSFIVY